MRLANPRFVLVVVLLSAVGCPQEAGQGPLGPLIETDIPEGIYTGTITWEVTTRVNGDVEDQQTFSDPYNEIVDSNGLPLVQPDGVPPRQNQSFRYDLAGTVVETRITAVHASGNRLVINYRSTIALDGVDIAGIGTWTYNFVAPNVLEFTDAFSGVSEVINGNIAGFEWTGTATVTK